MARRRRARRCFRFSLDSLQTIQELKKRGVSLWLPTWADVSGNGISEMMLTILAAVAQFELVRIGERIRDARARRQVLARSAGSVGSSRDGALAARIWTHSL